MVCVGNWVDYFRDLLDKYIDLENMWEYICGPHFFLGLLERILFIKHAIRYLNIVGDHLM